MFNEGDILINRFDYTEIFVFRVLIMGFYDNIIYVVKNQDESYSNLSYKELFDKVLTPSEIRNKLIDEILNYDEKS